VTVPHRSHAKILPGEGNLTDVVGLVMQEEGDGPKEARVIGRESLGAGCVQILALQVDQPCPHDLAHPGPLGHHVSDWRLIMMLDHRQIGGEDIVQISAEFGADELR
jgi:hypothetical protein